MLTAPRPARGRARAGCSRRCARSGERLSEGLSTCAPAWGRWAAASRCPRRLRRPAPELVAEEPEPAPERAGPRAGGAIDRRGGRPAASRSTWRSAGRPREETARYLAEHFDARRPRGAARRRLLPGRPVSARPAELTALRRARSRELTDLRGDRRAAVLGPEHDDAAAAAPRRGPSSRRRSRASLHARQTDPELGRLLDALEPWAARRGPGLRRRPPDRQAAPRLSRRPCACPTDLAAEISQRRGARRSRRGWRRATRSDFAPFRAALARHARAAPPLRRVLRRRRFAHPYDVLLDDFEPGLTTAELRPLFAELRDALVPLVAAAGGRDQPRNDGALPRPRSTPEAQRVAVVEVLRGASASTPTRWRLDPTVHPFAPRHRDPPTCGSPPATTSNDFAMAFYSALHEFGHGLYEAQIATRAAAARRSTTRSRSACTSPRAGCGRTSSAARGRSARGCCRGCSRTLAGPVRRRSTSAALYRAVNSVQPSLIRIEADETTYNLHIILRFELELALIEGSLAVDDAAGRVGRGDRAAARPRGPDGRRTASSRTSTGAPG